MKTTLSFVTALLLSITSLAQSTANLVIFSEDLEPFYAYVNGVKQNANAETNVRITGLNPNIALRIEFQNKALPVIKQNMMLEGGLEHTARLKYDKNKVMKLRYFGQVALNEAPKDNGAKNIEYHTADNSGSISSGSAEGNVNLNTQVSPAMNTNVNISSSTVTSTQSNGGNIEGGNINISMPGGVGISMSVPTLTANGEGRTSTSTTVTSTTINGVTETKSTTVQSNTGVHANQQPPKPIKPVRAEQVVVKTPTVAATPTVAVNAGCSVPMGTDAFNKLKSTIESKPFSDTKMGVARIATKNSCLSVNQIKEVCKLFSMDDDKLTYAKFAFDYCVDKANYYEVSDAFTFSTTQEAFLKFLDK